MGRVVALGERGRVSGFALAGAHVLVAEDPGSVQSAWNGLGPNVSVVILTPAAAAALGELVNALPSPDHPLFIVMPPEPDGQGQDP
jgi:vacuolar-type H+-ATPase subunit F/Vma7